MTPINFTVTFSELVTGFTDNTDVNISSTTGGTLAATITEITPNDGTTYDS
ncbi:hypothetical protein BGP_6227 [Beggiatoa sp. PS]|nr:hypothetical protein BGP_6227 [Beggiatoa sp. PS]